MFQTITRLYAMLSADVAVPATADKGRYIHFGATTIYCDENNVCSVYYPDVAVPAVPAMTTMIVSSA
jgi:hypothetical protein